MANRLCSSVGSSIVQTDLNGCVNLCAIVHVLNSNDNDDLFYDLKGLLDLCCMV